MDFSTVDELSQHFVKRLSIINKAVILCNATGDRSYIEGKNSLLGSLDSVRLELRKLRIEAEIARQQLHSMQTLKTDYDSLLQHLQFVVDHTPAQLPGKKRTETQQATHGYQNGTNPSVNSVGHSSVNSVSHSSVNSVGQEATSSCSYLDFLTVEEFEAVPKYMKGRLKYEKVNSIIEQLDNVFSEKYQVLRLKSSSLNDLNRKRVEAFRQQEKDAEGAVFIVEKDITDFASLKIDNNLRNVLTILRHCNIMREVRGGGHVRFATTSRW